MLLCIVSRIARLLCVGLLCDVLGYDVLYCWVWSDYVLSCFNDMLCYDAKYCMVGLVCGA